MSFTKSSRNVSVTSDFLLTAECKCINGEWNRSFLQLDKILGNADGSFEIEAGDFSKSAKDVILKNECGSTILHAALRKRDQTWQETSLNLDVIVANRNGVLCVDTSIIQPPGEGDTCSALEKLVADCKQKANELKKQIHEHLATEAAIASQSVKMAFKGVEHMQEALSDGGVYTDKQDFRPEAAHLGFLLGDATGQWSRVEDAMSHASQQIRDFLDEELHGATAEIGEAESRIAAEVDGTKLKQKEAKDHLQSLCDQINEHQKQHAEALNRRHDAWARTVGFSVASVLLPPVFIPLAIGASEEHQKWIKEVKELERKTEETSGLRDRLDGLQIGLERALQRADSSKEKCQRLRAELEALPDELRGLEERMHEKKCQMTEYSETLREAETEGVTAFEYSQTLEEGREILQEVLRVREDFDPEKLSILLKI